MKRNFFESKLGSLKNKAVKRKPLRTFVELSEEFGLTPGKLHMIIAKSGHPFPLCVNRPLHGSTWYEADAARKWWKENKPQ